MESGIVHICDNGFNACLSINFHYYQMHSWGFNSDSSFVVFEVSYFSEQAFHVEQNKYLLVQYVLVKYGLNDHNIVRI